MYTKDMERLLLRMWKKYASGKSVDHITEWINGKRNEDWYSIFGYMHNCIQGYLNILFYLFFDLACIHNSFSFILVYICDFEMENI